MDVTEAPPGQAVDGELGRVAELELRAVLAEKRLDEALGSAHRHQAESIRLHADNKGLRDRVEVLTRANHARSLRVRLGSWVRRAGWSR